METTVQVAIVSAAVIICVIVISLAYIRVREDSDRSTERTADTRADDARERRAAEATEARERRAAEAE